LAAAQAGAGAGANTNEIPMIILLLDGLDPALTLIPHRPGGR
jgi:hypothetical protein